MRLCVPKFGSYSIFQSFCSRTPASSYVRQSPVTSHSFGYLSNAMPVLPVAGHRRESDRTDLPRTNLSVTVGFSYRTCFAVENQTDVRLAVRRENNLRSSPRPKLLGPVKCTVVSATEYILSDSPLTNQTMPGQSRDIKDPRNPPSPKVWQSYSNRKSLSEFHCSGNSLVERRWLGGFQT